MSAIAQKLIELTGEQARRRVEVTMLGAPTLNPYLREMVKLAPRSQATCQPYDWQAARRDAGDLPAQAGGGPSSPASAARQRELVYGTYTGLGLPEPGLRGVSAPSAVTEVETAKTLPSLQEGTVAAAPEAQSTAQTLVQTHERPSAETSPPGHEAMETEDLPAQTEAAKPQRSRRPSAKKAVQATLETTTTTTTTKKFLFRKWTTEEFIHLLRTIRDNIDATWTKRINGFNQTFELSPEWKKARAAGRTKSAIMQKLNSELGTWGVEGLHALVESKLLELGAEEGSSTGDQLASAGADDEMKIEVVDLTGED